MKKINMIATIVIAIVLTGCNSIEPPPPGEKPTLKLKLEDASCTETWIELTTTNLQLPTTIVLEQDDNARDTISLTTADILLYIDSLLPNTNYNYQVSSIPQSGGENSATSNKLNVTTMDTTSHNFTWQTFTFGNPNFGSSDFSDVAIIDENDIWAVGEIYNDTTGLLYNAAHWDGNNWTTIRVPYYYQGQPFYNPIQTIFAFASNDIWFGGNGIIHWDGNQYIPIPIPTIVWGPHQINKIWGTSANDLYIVGNDGKIAHYQNGQWNSIASGTDANLRDVYGVNKPATGNLKILAIVEKLNDYRIFTLTSSIAEDTLNWQPGTHLSGVWLDGRKTYAAGTNIWVNQYNQWQQKTFTGFFYTTIRGNKSNNIYGIGPDGIIHFNGLDWQLIKQRPTGIVMLSGNCNSSLVAAVGFSTTGGSVGEAVVLLANQQE
jgi:hypothetical protein